MPTGLARLLLSFLFLQMGAGVYLRLCIIIKNRLTRVDTRS